MSLLLYLASGIPFVLGAALCALAPLLARVDRSAARWGGRAFVIAGLLLISLSATPMPLWLASAGAIAGLAWLRFGVRLSRRAPRARLALDAALAVLSPLALALELPYQNMPRLKPGNLTRLCVLGDSLSAGIRDGERTWPRVLSETHGLDVANLARAGATTDDARRQAEALPENPGVVVILIGGNDVLNGSSSADFERDLDAAVATASRKAAAVVMFELPVPPLANRFAAIQRSVARRHRAHLIPKRVLALLLADSANTSDGLHLSSAGHEHLSEIVWNVVRPAVRARGVVVNLTSSPAEIRLVTWNVHKCEAGWEHVADVLESLAPHVVCLQELVEPRGLSGGVDQTEQLRRKLDLHAFSFGGPLDNGRNQSIAILSRWPLRNAEALHASAERNWGVTAIVDVGPNPVRIVSVHLAGTWKIDASHILQTSAAREADFDGMSYRLRTWNDPHILIAGDFNQPEASANFGRLAPRLRRVDCGGATFPSDSPVITLDHVLVPRGADIAKCEVIESDASDHRPLLVVLRGWGG